MTQNEIPDLPKLSIEQLENIFNVYKTEDNMYYYNLLQTVVFPQNLPDAMFDLYTIRWGDTWPLISFKFYNTPNLWWIILLANNIINPIKFPKIGEELLIPTTAVVKLILSQIK